MKSLILLALFALAANAAFNITAFGIGEAQQYGLTAEQIEQDAVPCFNALQTSFDNLVQLFETKDLVTILSGFSALYEQFQTDAENTCHPYAVDAGTYIYENAPNHAANLTETMKQNFEKYYAQVIQQVAIEINDIIAGNFEAAGAAKGVSSQILFGIVTPQTLPVPQFNYSLYVPFNVEEFSTEYFTALFSAIGSNQSISGSQISACLSEIITFTTNIESLIGNFSSYTFADKIVGISSFFEESGETLESCEYYAEIFAPISGPLFEAFKANPVSFVLHVANNIAMNAPQFVQSAQQEEVYILEGEYASAGELKGERFKQIFGFAGF